MHRALTLLVLLLAACAPAPDDFSPNDRRVLLVAMDGADTGIFTPLIERGALPNLGRLQRQSAQIMLASDPAHSLESARLWTSVATGYTHAEHQVPLSAVRRKGRYDEVPITSIHRQRLALWEMLSTYDLKVAVVGWWATWPAEWVHGYLVSDRFFLDRFAAGPFAPGGRPDLWPLAEEQLTGAPYLTFPDALAAELESSLRPRSVPTDPHYQFVQELLQGEQDFRRREHLQMLANALRHDYLAKEALLALLRRDAEVRFSACYFDAMDVACHLFWMYMQPEPWQERAPQDLSPFNELIGRVAVTLDGYLGELCTAVGQEAAVMVVSGHGFVHNAGQVERDFNLNPLLEKLGLLVRQADGTIDFSRTQCFDRPSSPLNHRRRLSMNFAGDYPEGFVPADDGQQRSQAWEGVGQLLSTVRVTPPWKHPDTGEDATTLFYDLVRVPWDMEYAVFPEMAPETRVQVRGRLYPLDEILRPRPVAGRHDQSGFVLVSLPGEEGRRMSQLEAPLGQGYVLARHVTPTILSLFDLPRPLSPAEPMGRGILWIYPLDDAQRQSMRTVPSFERTLGRRDLGTPLGRRYEELKEYLDGQGYELLPSG